MRAARGNNQRQQPAITYGNKQTNPTATSQQQHWQHLQHQQHAPVSTYADCLNKPSMRRPVSELCRSVIEYATHGGNLTLRQNMTTATAQATPVKMNICADRWTLKSFSLKRRMFTSKENTARNKRTLEYTIWESQD